MRMAVYCHSEATAMTFWSHPLMARVMRTVLLGLSVVERMRDYRQVLLLYFPFPLARSFTPSLLPLCSFLERWQVGAGSSLNVPSTCSPAVLRFMAQLCLTPSCPVLTTKW